MKPLSKVLTVLGCIWLGGVLLLVFVSAVAIGVMHGLGEAFRIFSPFNIWNALTILICMLPGIGLLSLSDKLDRPSKTNPAD
jgi:hypothetical protein